MRLEAGHFLTKGKKFQLKLRIPVTNEISDLLIRNFVKFKRSKGLKVQN